MVGSVKYYLILFILFSCVSEKKEKTAEYDNSLRPDLIGTGYTNTVFASSVKKPYVPLIKINRDKIFYVAPDSLGNGLSENLPTTFQDAINKADSACTIIALDGVYRLKVMVDTLKYVTVISKNKWGAKIIPKGTDSDEAAFVFYSRNDIHHVNFIGLEVMGGEEGMRQFIFSPGTYLKGVVHHIYIADVKMHELKMGIYSGLNSHDWTVNRCQFYNSRMSYLWYCMGYHQTVMNTLMYNNTYLSIALRGHYPLNEDYHWNGVNTLINDRKKAFLDKEDWTHLIINNTFGTVKDTTRPNEGMLGLFYDIVPGEETKSEACYFPPQNVIIANNVFVDNGPQKKVPFYIYASRGINTGKVYSVNGLTLKNNVTSQKELILGGNETDISLITDMNNNIVNAGNIGFEDEKNHNYNLTPGSADLIDRSARDLYRVSLDNRDIKRDKYPDIGAFEYIKSLK